MPCLLYPQRRAPGTHLIGGWADPRANVDVVLKTKVHLLLLRVETQSSGPYPSHYTD